MPGVTFPDASLSDLEMDQGQEEYLQLVAALRPKLSEALQEQRIDQDIRRWQQKEAQLKLSALGSCREMGLAVRLASNIWDFTIERRSYGSYNDFVAWRRSLPVRDV